MFCIIKINVWRLRKDLTLPHKDFEPKEMNSGVLWELMREKPSMDGEILIRWIGVAGV